MDTDPPRPIPTAPDAGRKDPEPALVAGAAYADVRTRLLADGWRPVPDPHARAQVIGDDHARLCAEHPGLARCRACDALPELCSASADGLSVMRFARDGKALRVIAYGTLADFDVTGEDSGLVLRSWEFPAAHD